MLIRLCVGDRCGDLSAHQVEELYVRLVQGPARTASHDQEAREPILAAGLQGHHKAVLDQVGPRVGLDAHAPQREVGHLLPALHGEGSREVPCALRTEQRHCGGQCRLGKDAGGCDPVCFVLARVDQVERGERHVRRILRKDVDGTLAAHLDGIDAGDAGGKIPQHAQPALADHSVGDLRDHAQHPGDPIPVIVNGTVGERVIRLLRKPLALQKQQEALIPRRRAAAEDVRDARTDVRPDLFPDLVGTRPQHPVALVAYRRKVRVIAEEGEFRTPQHPHRIA